jgi:hypothetical protein
MNGFSDNLLHFNLAVESLSSSFLQHVVSKGTEIFIRPKFLCIFFIRELLKTLFRNCLFLFCSFCVNNGLRNR